jgi:hypothetical protein
VTKLDTRVGSVTPRVFTQLCTELNAAKWRNNAISDHATSDPSSLVRSSHSSESASLELSRRGDIPPTTFAQAKALLCSENDEDKVILASFARVNFYDETAKGFENDKPKYELHNRFSTNCATNQWALIGELENLARDGDDQAALTNCRRRIEEANEKRAGGLHYYEVSNAVMDEVLRDWECSSQSHTANSRASPV